MSHVLNDGSSSPSNLESRGDMKGDMRKRRSSLPETGAADDLLENLGYKPELSRNRSTLQVAFMSFVLASIPYGLATTLIYPLTGGGPVDIIWGWFAVSLIIVCVAASLGEITSIYPTAGGKYRFCPDLLKRCSCPQCAPETHSAATNTSLSMLSSN